MKAQPLVALTTTSVGEGGTHMRPQILLYSAYIAALEQLSLVPVLLTPYHSARSVQGLLEQCRGLILSGGEDVDPARYGEEPHAALGAVTPERDEMEMTALALAFERELPVLAICRGVQVLNVFMGGTLYQDLASQRPGPIDHQQTEPWGERSHTVRIEPGSKLAGIVETHTLRINSFHHQAIRNLAPGLRVTATAEDGLIEAVEAENLPLVVGVQWHPERHEASAPDTDPDRRLFAAFRRAIVGRSRVEA